MSVSNWLRNNEARLLVALGALIVVVLTLFMAVPQLPGRPSNSNQDTTSQHKSQQKRDWRPSFYPAEPYAAYHNANCQAPKNREEADLCQQWRVAEATEKSVALADSLWGWSVFQAFVTAVASVATALAAWAAGNAAASARESVGVATRSITELERPFVVAKGVKAGLVPEDMRVVAQLENSGATPTRKLIQQINVRPFPGGMPKDFDFHDGKSSEEPTVAVLGPKTEYNTGSIDVPVGMVAAALAGQAKIYVWGWAEYDDIFPDTPRHRTEYCFELRASRVGDDITLVPVLFSRHNAMDGDCPPERWRTLKGGIPNPAFV